MLLALRTDLLQFLHAGADAFGSACIARIALAALLICSHCWRSPLSSARVRYSVTTSSRLIAWRAGRKRSDSSRSRMILLTAHTAISCSCAAAAS